MAELKPTSDAGDSAYAQNSEGRNLLQAENYQGALRAFSRAIELDPDYLFAYRNRAEVYRRLGRSVEAEADEEVWGNPPQVAAERGSARAVVEQHKGERRRATNKGIVAMFLGVLIFAGGIIATIWSYMGAEPGGTYVFWYGSIVAGIISFFGGLATMKTGKSG